MKRKIKIPRRRMERNQILISLKVLDREMRRSDEQTKIALKMTKDFLEKRLEFGEGAEIRINIVFRGEREPDFDVIPYVDENDGYL